MKKKKKDFEKYKPCKWRSKQTNCYLNNLILIDLSLKRENLLEGYKKIFIGGPSKFLSDRDKGCHLLKDPLTKNTSFFEGTGT